mmetsp:Transcript_85064/g.214381  ORF Transcript_85064/g.214381 Transcript_85064/m.214381 type:complete len:305 (+) Transcript_85064:917-1831(+)
MPNKGSTTDASEATSVPTEPLIVTLATRRTSFTSTLSVSCASFGPVPAGVKQLELACANLRSCCQYRSSSTGRRPAMSQSNINVRRKWSLLAVRLPRAKLKRRTRVGRAACSRRQWVICWSGEGSASRTWQAASVWESLAKTRAMLTCNSLLAIYMEETTARVSNALNSTSCCCLFDEAAKFLSKAVTCTKSWASWALPVRPAAGLSNDNNPGRAPCLTSRFWLSSLFDTFFNTPTTNTRSSVEPTPLPSAPSPSINKSGSKMPSSRKCPSFPASLLNLKRALATLRYAASTPCKPTSFSTLST